jgi:hypothetical protein
MVHACLAAALAVLGSSASAQPKPPPPRFSDPAVAEASKKGADFLWSRQNADGSWAPYGQAKDDKGNETATYNPAGPTSLAVYALLESGVSAQDERMAKALNWLAGQPSVKTYTLGIRCSVWESANRQTRGKYYTNLGRDTRLLVESTKGGSYGYWSRGDGKSEGDNSNSQYGLLGAWAGSRGGVEGIPREYWDKVLRHWIVSQCTDGGWAYQKENPDSTATMTTAGLASLFVCYDNLYSDKFEKIGATNELEPVLRRGLDWMDRKFPGTISSPTDRFYYYLYGVERVGLASGFKYFGKADWYKLGVTKLLELQKPDGAWGNGDVDTSFALLFLIRGRHAVLFNKLEREGDWCNRPRDLATLTRWITQKFETPVNWQVINLKVPVREWHDAPILYIAGYRAPKFTEEDLANLRTFVFQGGMILSCTEGSGPFGQAIRDIYKKLFPQYALSPVPPGHDLYSNVIQYNLSGRPKLLMVSNGIRPLAIHTDEDLARCWQLGKVATERWAFEAATNIYMYAADKSSLRYRGVSLWPEEVPATTQPAASVKLARLRHSGDFDPEPLAYERFARLLAANDKIQLDVSAPMPIGQLGAAGVKVAALTGTGELKLTDEEKTALKDWIEGGGTLVADAAGGSKAFAESFEQLLTGLFGTDALKDLPSNSAVYNLPGKAIGQVKFRRQTSVELGGKRTAMLQGVSLKDRATPAVIYSSLDLTEALLGCPAYHCRGYAPESAYQLMRNILLVAGGAK